MLGESVPPKLASKNRKKPSAISQRSAKEFRPNGSPPLNSTTDAFMVLNFYSITLSEGVSIEPQDSTILAILPL